MKNNRWLIYWNEYCCICKCTSIKDSFAQIPTTLNQTLVAFIVVICATLTITNNMSNIQTLNNVQDAYIKIQTNELLINAILLDIRKNLVPNTDYNTSMVDKNQLNNIKTKLIELMSLEKGVNFLINGANLEKQHQILYMLYLDTQNVGHSSLPHLLNMLEYSSVGNKKIIAKTSDVAKIIANFLETSQKITLDPELDKEFLSFSKQIKQILFYQSIGMFIISLIVWLVLSFFLGCYFIKQGKQ